MQKGLDGHLCTATSAVVDPALLAKVDTNRRVSRCFDLRMSEFVTADAFDENVEPTKRKSRRLSLTLKRKTVSTASSCAKKPRKALRPRNETISEADYSDMAVPFVPSSTKKNNQWAYNNFITWRDERNARNPDNRCPEDLLRKTPFDVVALAHWLPRYACETRTKGKNKYPGSTILCLLGGLLREMRALSQACPNFLDTSDVRFREMHSIIDTYFRQLRSDGVGAIVKHATLINKEEENLLWEHGVVGDDTPERLLHAVFYYNGKNVCLRGGKEHRALKISQFVRSYDPDQYVYKENGSKNRSGGNAGLRTSQLLSWLVRMLGFAVMFTF